MPGRLARGMTGKGAKVNMLGYGFSLYFWSCAFKFVLSGKNEMKDLDP